MNPERDNPDFRRRLVEMNPVLAPFGTRYNYTNRVEQVKTLPEIHETGFIPALSPNIETSKKYESNIIDQFFKNISDFINNILGLFGG